MAITTLFLTGFEHGLVTSTSGLGLFDSVTGTPTVVTANVRNGTYSLQCAPSASAVFAAKNASGTKGVMRFGLRNSVRPSGNASTVAGVLIGASTLVLTLDIDGTLKLAVGAGTAQTFGVLTLNQWYLVELQIDASGTTWTADWRVNGTAQTQATLAGQAAGSPLGTAALGVASGTATYTCQYDDWIFGNYTAATDWYGDGKVLSYLPGSDGTHSFTANDFTSGDAGTTGSSAATDWHTFVDDAPPWTTARSTTDDIVQRVIRTTGYIELIPVTPTEVTNANAVRALLAYSSTGTAQNSAACIIRNSAGTAVVIFGDLPVGQGGNGGALSDYSESTNFFKGAIVTVPAAGWTPAEIAALRWRLGGSGDVTPLPTWQALMLEVDWPVALAPALHLRRPSSAPSPSPTQASFS